MTTDRSAVTSPHQPWWPRLRPAILLIVTTTIMAYVIDVVSQHTVNVVQARRLLPRWDLATHLGYGWLDYHLLATGRIPALLWDLWLQGYWPPMLSIYQVPFYLALGGGKTSGLWSALVAFIFTGVTGTALLERQWKNGGALPAGLFIALLISSPYLLAYASVPMTEVLGALTQLLVLLTWLRYRQHPGAGRARLFAVSLTILFFTKYNYFFLLAAPLVLHEWLERTAGFDAGRRLTGLWRSTWHILATPTGLFVSLYLVALLIVMRTGGFDLHLLGRRISVHTIGNTGHVVLYLLLWRLWFLHRRGRIDWARLTSADPRIRPLLRWFALPVAIWFASPYPNHIRDFANLVFNRPLGDATVSAGLATYLDALRTMYFYNEWILLAMVIVFGVAAVQYRRQPALMRCLILAVPLQFAVIALHQTRFPRFLLLTVVLLCLAAAGEVGRWFAGSRRGRLAGSLLAPIVVVCGVMAAREAVTQARFRTIAFENYTDNGALVAALDAIRAGLNAGDRLAIVGQSNELSPGLFRWELGPPSGVACFPFEIGGARGVALGLATRVLLLAPLGPDVEGPLDLTSYYLAQRRAVEERIGRGDLTLRRDIPLPDMRVVLRIYDRTSRTGPKASCNNPAW